MINLDSITNENNKYSRPSVHNIDDWWFWIRKNKHIALIKGQDNDNTIDEIYLYAKDLSEPKY